MTISDASALFAEYQDSGAEFTQTLSDKPWGMREFGIRTIDGHRIMFGQELKAQLMPDSALQSIVNPSVLAAGG